MRKSKAPSKSTFIVTNPQEENAYIRKNPLYTMIVERNSYLNKLANHRHNGMVKTEGNDKPWIDDNGIQFLNIYDFLLEDLFE